MELSTFINGMYFLVFDGEILEVLILFLALRSPVIQNFPKFIEIAKECLIYVKKYEQLLLTALPRFVQIYKEYIHKEVLFQ